MLFFSIPRMVLSQPTYSLANLDYSNPLLKRLREDIKNNLRASHSNRVGIEFTELEFYEYTVKKEDHFFLIMSKTSMDMDTLMSVNELASPYEILPGQKLRIPNMRGVLYEKSCPQSSDCTEEVSKLERIDKSKLFYDKISKRYFIPGGKIQNKEKMFFLGKGFFPPLEKYRLTSSFGKRNDPFTNIQTFHGGVDLAAPEGTPVYASADGTIQFVGKRGGYGNLIILKHDHGYETRYGHLKNFLGSQGKTVKLGDSVRKGEKIGEVGMTGRATGNHLHFEVRRFSKPERPILR